MTDWEAKYKSVVGFVEPKHVEAAERIVAAAIQMADATAQPLDRVVGQILHVASRMKFLDNEGA